MLLHLEGNEMNYTSFKLIMNTIGIYFLFKFSNCQNDLCRLFYVIVI
jgi:hypothetical protein